MKRKIGKLIYKFDLPSEMQIYPIILIIYFELMIDDSFKRINLPPISITIEGEERFLVNRIIRKERRR
jgi:hypothetical protein